MELAKIKNSKAYCALTNTEHASKLEAISGKIQEFQIKTDTAIQIKTTYKGIIKVLEKVISIIVRRSSVNFCKNETLFFIYYILEQFFKT